MHMDGRTCVITGAGRGIGRGIAEHLGREGANVVVNYRTSGESAEAACETIRREGGDAIAPGGGENPTLVFEVGRRYVVENGGWDAHPFGLRTGDDTDLLSQQPTITGRYEDDPAVDWIDDGDSFASQVGLSAGHHANVTLVAGDSGGGGPHPVCSDGTRITVSATDECTSGFALDAGEPVPPDGASVIGRRVVYVDGTTATVIVRMW